MSDSQAIAFDVRAVEDAAHRAAIARELGAHGWPEASRAKGYLPTIAIGNPARFLVAFKERDSQPDCFLALVRMNHEEDETAASDLVERCGSLRILLSLELLSPKTDPSLHIVPRVERLAARLAPDRIRSARFADGILFVVFGDGLAHAFEWRRTKLLSRLDRVRPESAAVSEELDSVVVLDQRGREIDIDGLSLRRLVDDSVAAEASEHFSAARKRLGLRLRELREAANLSQEDLETRSGLPQESISRLESGNRVPRLETLVKLARGLGVPLERLLRTIEAQD